MRVAVTGAGGRLGRALLAALGDAPFAGPAGPIGWTRPGFDLDAPERFGGLLDADRPEVVIHAAAWTDVDACAREPELALRRNGEATGRLAEACAARAIDLVVVSTNEVFDGRRTDGRGYAAGDPTDPPNAYGASKAAGEAMGAAAFAGIGVTLTPYLPRDTVATGPQLAVVRTAWLYGPPGADFPDKITAAAARTRDAGVPLRVVGDEYGDPTSTTDLAEAIVELLAAPSFGGIHHCVDRGPVSRATWARAVLAGLDVAVQIEEVPADTWQRASTPPRWGVLEPTPMPSGMPMRPWDQALIDDLAWRRRRGGAPR